jgi:hypothetical protein
MDCNAEILFKKEILRVSKNTFYILVELLSCRVTLLVFTDVSLKLAACRDQEVLEISKFFQKPIITYKSAEPVGYAVSDVGLRPHDCWDSWFESR